MNKYIVSVEMTHIPEDIKEGVIQQEMAKVKELKKQMIVDQLLLGEEGRNAWMIINANDKDEVSGIMKSLPIFPYIQINQTIQLRSVPSQEGNNQS
ncbi:MAG: hypothetical protein GPJ54_16210 [Candidatus Heimdallarchaeota archaeon]|nr:hypothetical protein [Candidatus Heimdallarchaeota archaeon]